MRFSVIMPAHNAARFVRQAIDSVLAQTHEDFELIVIDDSSEDATVELVSTRLKDSRVQLRSIPTGAPTPAGCGETRNYGLRYATGSHVAFLDADDVWFPGKLERCRDRIRETGTKFVFSDGFIIDGDGRKAERLLGKGMKSRIRVADPLLLLTNLVTVSSVVVARDLLSPDPFVNLRRMLGAEDYCLWLRINRKTELHYENAALIGYRRYAGQLSDSYLQQLMRTQAVLSAERSGLVETYGEPFVALGEQLLQLRMRWAKREMRALLRQTLGMLRGIDAPRRRVLREYLRYGLSCRAKQGLLKGLRERRPRTSRRLVPLSQAHMG